jgi:hypothetical protein
MNAKQAYRVPATSDGRDRVVAIEKAEAQGLELGDVNLVGTNAANGGAPCGGRALTRSRWSGRNSQRIEQFGFVGAKFGQDFIAERRFRPFQPKISTLGFDADAGFLELR